MGINLMQKNILNNYSRLVIATLDDNGNINPDIYQPLNTWNQGVRNTELIAPMYGNSLIDILDKEFGLIDVDSKGLLKHKILHLNTYDLHITVMRLLGKIAEAVIVDECNKNIFANRKWGRVARRGRRVHKSLDSFKAIGTGLKSTQNNHSTKYNPADTQRDIIWINKENEKNELLQIGSNPNSAISAGLQIKVSHDGFKYIYRSDIARGKYEVPLIYFDLSNDYIKLTNAIYKEELDIEIGYDIVRGYDISSEIHDLLISYYWLIYELIDGKLNINQLVNNKLLMDVLLKERQEENGKKIIVI